MPRRCHAVRSSKLLPALLLLSTIGAPLGAGTEPTSIRYRLSVADRDHHEARIEVHFGDLPAAPLEVRMSRTSPGRYALHEFAKNVYGVEVTDGRGRPLEVQRPDLHQWTVAGHDGSVIFRYTLFGDHCDGTYASIDASHAHLNIPATFAWARGLEDRPIQVELELPDDWTVATQLEQTDAAGRRFRAPDLAYFMDSPIEASRLHRSSWSIGGTAEEQTVTLALHHLGTAEEAEVLADLAKLVVDEQIAIFGEPPRFDYGRYVFIADYLPWAERDGMEHRNSTVLTNPQSIRERVVGNLATVSHEFFHVWNVERIRPRSLEPFDLEAASLSSELWFAEGFTSYYGALTLKRIGVLSLERYAEQLAAAVGGVLGAPGRELSSAAEMSAQAAFVDAATSNDATNRANTFISYYTYGNALALGLDLLLRTRFPGLDLDRFMLAAWQRFGREELPYDNEGLEELLDELTGDAEFAGRFFEHSVLGREPPPFAELLAAVGLVLRQARPEAAALGSTGLSFEESGARVEEAPLVGGALYRAGVGRRDLLQSLDGRPISSPESLAAVLQSLRPRQVVPLVLTKRGEERTVELILDSDPELEVVPVEATGRRPDPESLALRQAWLGPRSSPRVEVRRYCPQTGLHYTFEHEFCPVHGAPLSLVPPNEQ